MKRTDHIHPLTLVVYYVTVLFFICFEMHPVTAVTGLCCVLCSSKWMETDNIFGKIRQLCFIFIVAALLNPLFYHNGATPLFYINGKPITAEASIYGLVMGITVLSVLFLCMQFQQIFTSEKILYLVGKISPKSALILSMSLRMIPMYQMQFRKIKEVQKSLGAYGEGTLFDICKENLEVFSATITWALEHSMETADAMRARGYGTGKRTYFMIFRMKKMDVFLCILQGIMVLGILLCKARGWMQVYYYPYFEIKASILEQIAVNAFFAGMVLAVPFVIFIKYR